MRFIDRETPGLCARPVRLPARVRPILQALPWKRVAAAQAAGRILVHVPPAATPAAVVFAPVAAGLSAVPCRTPSTW